MMTGGDWKGERERERKAAPLWKNFIRLSPE